MAAIRGRGDGINRAEKLGGNPGTDGTFPNLPQSKIYEWESEAGQIA